MIGAETLAVRLAPVLQPHEHPLVELALPQREAHEVLADLERVLRRREEDAVRARTEPERPAYASGEEDHARLALVEPGRGHGAAELLECRAARAVSLGEG